MFSVTRRITRPTINFTKRIVRMNSQTPGNAGKSKHADRFLNSGTPPTYQEGTFREIYEMGHVVCTVTKSWYI